jgi:hypothetical protein
MSIPNRHRSPKSVRGRFPSTGVWLQVDTIEKILELTLADREHGRAFVRWPRDPECPPIKSLVKTLFAHSGDGPLPSYFQDA